jgi:hypothetical protein
MPDETNFLEVQNLVKYCQLLSIIFAKMLSAKYEHYFQAVYIDV